MCVCSRHSVSPFSLAVSLFLLFSIPFPLLSHWPGPCVLPHLTLFSFYVVSRFFFHFRVEYPFFLTDGLSKIDYYLPLFPSFIHPLSNFATRMSPHSLPCVVVSAPPPLIFFPYIMHAHAHAHLFGFSQVVATADAVAQALSTSPRQKKGLIQAHSFASTISEFSLFLLSSLPHFASLKKKQYSFAFIVQKVDRSNSNNDDDCVARCLSRLEGTQ